MGAQGSTERVEEGPASANQKAVAAPKPLVVERLTHQDVPNICALYKRVWDAFRPELPSDLIKAWEPTPLEFTSWMEGVTYFAARRDGKMVGAVGCELSEGSCRIVHLAVDPDSRRQGVARALTTAALEWARHNNSHSIWADALERFGGAAELFKHLGFAECGIFHKHYWNEDVRLFEMML
ncbi:MAG: GNAT family N-acetyltransferase [Thermoplasmata archaeon]|nr:GNAT family N-acetyltransferase [Thermoplasmata archaeon]